MLNNLKGARLGLFVFLGTVLFVVGIFLIGNKQSLFDKSVNIKTYFENIEGLRTGAPVRLSGLNIGTVTSIKLVPDSVNRVEVSLNVQENLINFIRLDSQAGIETEGLVGAKIVTISPGSDDYDVVTNGSVIRSKKPVNMAAIIEKTTGIMAYVEQLTRDFSQIVTKVNEGNGTIGQLINDDRLYNASVKVTESANKNFNSITKRLADISDFVITLGGSIENIIVNVDTAVADVKTLVANVEQGQGVIGALMADQTTYDSLKLVVTNLVTTTEESMAGARAFSENMEALKHNWLFKSYFEERGYWDRDKQLILIEDKTKFLEKQQEILQGKVEELRLLEKKLGIKADFTKDQSDTTK